MRKQMDGLGVLVREAMKRDPEAGDFYLFQNRKRDLIKILFYDHGGYCLLAKRLCKGRFKIEVEHGEGVADVRISSGELALLLSEAKIVQQHSS